MSLLESFGALAVGGGLHLDRNQLVILPESFGALTVGGDLYLKGFAIGKDIGPAHAEASRLHYPNVRGEVRK